MSFNPSKCEVVRVTKRGIQLMLDIKFMTTDWPYTRRESTWVLSFLRTSLRPHVDATIKKANTVYRRNLTRCPQEVKAQCYKTLVRPILEYATAAWDPYTNTCIQQLKVVQCRAARFVKGDYKTTSSTSQMLQDLGWAVLEQRRQNAKLVMIYHITYGLVDIPASSFLHPLATSTRGHALRYFIPYCRTDTYLHSFFPSGIRLWNQLPEHIAISEILEYFKRGLATIH